MFQGEESLYNETGSFECRPCAEGCETCINSKPCVLALNWILRTTILILSCFIIFCVLIVELFTWKYRNLKVWFRNLFFKTYAWTLFLAGFQRKPSYWTWFGKMYVGLCVCIYTIYSEQMLCMFCTCQEWTIEKWVHSRAEQCQKYRLYRKLLQWR